MKKWTKRLLTLCLLFVALELLASCLFPKIYWVGSKDLDITFIVTDEETGEPISTAKINVVGGEHGFCHYSQPIPFTLAVSQPGSITVHTQGCMCSGTSGWNGWKLIDTFSLHVPGWEYTVEAPGYVPSEVFYLGSSEDKKSIQRGRDFAAMVVRIRLHRQRQ